MGLDMYLMGKLYCSNYSNPKIFESVKKLLPNLIGKKEDDGFIEIEKEIIYWRKANQIHNWFVRNAQDGKDDCGTYYIVKEQLEELLNICETILKSTKLVDGAVTNGASLKDGEWQPNIEMGKIIEDDSVAKKLLPSQEGFFFGGTDYDQWYWQDIEYTAKNLKKLLKSPNFDKYDYYYSSSW